MRMRKAAAARSLRQLTRQRRTETSSSRRPKQDNGLGEEDDGSGVAGGIGGGDGKATLSVNPPPTAASLQKFRFVERERRGGG